MSLAVNNNTPVRQNINTPAVGGGTPQVDAEKIMQEATSIMEGVGLFVAEMNLNGVETKSFVNTGKKVDIDEVPELDSESVENMLTILEDLEKLIAELKSDSTEEQIQLAKERIANLRDKLKQQQTERLGKIDESMKQIDEATDAQKSQKKMGIFSCVMAVLSAIIAVAAVAAALFTGGASIAVAVAVIGCIGALCNVGSAAVTIYQTANQEELQQQVKDKAAEYREQGMSSSEAWKKASSDVNDKFMIASIALSIGGLVGGLVMGGANSVSNVAQIIAIVQAGMSAVSIAGSIANAVISDDASDKSYDSQATQAELQQLEALLEKLKKALDEDSEELQKLLQALQESLAQLAQLMQSSVSTTDEIAQQTGATA